MSQATKRRTGRRRWAELVKFLTHEMKTNGNPKLRMMAAQRLAEILLVREQREIAELRAAAREAERKTVPKTTATEGPEESPAPVSTDDAIEKFLASIRQKGVTAPNG